MLSKWEKAFIKEYIDNIYTINCATFLEVSDKKKIRKVLSRRGSLSNVAYLRSSNLIVMPYSDSIYFYNAFGDLINEFVNSSYKPVCGDALLNSIDHERLSGFLKTMIIRNNIKWVSYSSKSLLYLMDTLMKELGIRTKVSLKHMMMKILSEPAELVRDIHDYEYSIEDLKNYGWILKLDRMHDDSSIKYRKIKFSNGVVVIFNINGKDFNDIEKYDNYITTGDNYKRIASLGFTGFRWIIRGDALLKRKKRKSNLNLGLKPVPALTNSKGGALS